MENEHHLLLGKLMNDKNHMTAAALANLPVKDKRKFFAIIRKNQPLDGVNYLFPASGLTLGELCTAHVLQIDTKRKQKR
jgi:hypothetical protein